MSLCNRNKVQRKHVFKPLSLVVLALLLAISKTYAAEPLATIHLNEVLGQHFAAEALHYNLEIGKGALKQIGLATLRDDAGLPVLAQFKEFDNWDDGSVHHLQVSFVAGLEPGERKGYTVDASGACPSNDGALKTLREGKDIVFSSPLCAVRIPAQSGVFPDGTSALSAPPPFSQIRGPVKWYGRGWLDADMPVKSRTVKVSEDGPITKSASIEYTFAGDEKYVVQVSLNRGEQLIRVKEDYTLTYTEPTRAEFAFDMAPGLHPNMSIAPQAHKPGPAPVSVGSYWDLTPYRGDLFPIKYNENAVFGELMPWSVYPNQWVHFACYNSRPGGDMLGIINTAPDKWSHVAYSTLPDQSWKLLQNPNAFFTFRRLMAVPVTMGTDKSLVVHFKLTTGHREWAFFIGNDFPRTETVPEGSGPKAQVHVYNSAPRTWFTQKTRDYCLNSLDRIKNYTLEWPHDDRIAYPHLYAGAADYEARRGPFNAWYGSELLPSLDDPATKAKLKKLLLDTTSQAISTMMVNPGPPHHITQQVYLSANLADLVLGRGILSPAEEGSVRARLAFVAYTLNWPGYWAPENGAAANPNMSSFTYDGVGLLGLLLSDHPESATWIKACCTELDREIANWISKDGGWIESISYTLAAWNEHCMAMGSLKYNGIRDYYADPRVRKFLRYYLAMQTPPDPQFNFQRGNVEIGNSYIFENVDDFSMWAKGVKDADPILAANLMWNWRQIGYGNQAQMKGKIFKLYGASFDMWWGVPWGIPPYYNVALKDHTIEPVAPVLPTAQKFDGFGAVIQSHVPGDRETKVFFREGQTYSHWDMDQGSFVLWAKGAPLCMDHGYGEFQPWFHNSINVNHMGSPSLGDVTSFFSGQNEAMLRGDITIDTLDASENPAVKEWPMTPEPINGREMRTPWTRKLIFLGDADAAGPNYFVLRDTVRGQLPTEWCLWTYADIGNFESTPIRAKGKFGVDLLVYLLDKDRGQVNTGRVELPPDRRAQTLIHLRRPAGRGVLSVLFPVLSGEAAPEVTALPGETGVKVAVDGRTDWVFLPEERGSANVDGIAFNGSAASYSQRGATSYYMVERNTQLTAGGLGLYCNFPIDLALDGDIITGQADSSDAESTLVLSGPVAARAKTVTVGGTTEPLKVGADGTVQVHLPAGNAHFQIALQ